MALFTNFLNFSDCSGNLPLCMNAQIIVWILTGNILKIVLIIQDNYYVVKF